jgi:hypothetical protein
VPSGLVVPYAFRRHMTLLRGLIFALGALALVEFCRPTRPLEARSNRSTAIREYRRVSCPCSSGRFLRPRIHPARERGGLPGTEMALGLAGLSVLSLVVGFMSRRSQRKHLRPRACWQPVTPIPPRRARRTTRVPRCSPTVSHSHAAQRVFLAKSERGRFAAVPVCDGYTPPPSPFPSQPASNPSDTTRRGSSAPFLSSPPNAPRPRNFPRS